MCIDTNCLNDSNNRAVPCFTDGMHHVAQHAKCRDVWQKQRGCQMPYSVSGLLCDPGAVELGSNATM